MCTTSLYTYVYPDGRKEKTRRSTCCPSSRHGVPCANNVLFEHPHQMVSYSGAPELPPTPSYTPRSSTPNYRSGDESDRSGRGRRQSSYNLGTGRSANITTTGSSSRRERIVLVENPPMARTPPRTHTMPHTAPSSPSAPYILSASPRRPFIVDERPRSPHVQIEIVPASSRRRSGHVRYASTSSRESRHSHSEEESSRRRAEREAARRESREAENQAQSRATRLATRIARANAEISTRPPVAVPTPPPSASRRPSTYAQRAGDIVDSMRGLRLEEDQKRRREEREDEAQRQRLMERMMPRRRATVGPGSRRPRVLYDEGVFRME